MTKPRFTRAAIDVLVRLHELPPGPFLDYSLSEYLREVRLFMEWYCTARKHRG